MSSSELYPEVSVILPCQNEERALGACIDAINETIQRHDIDAEIIVSDSSSDTSAEIAKAKGVILKKHDKEGYGNAYKEGFKVARGKYIFCVDADGTYDFAELPKFIHELKNGADLVLGNRFAGVIDTGAMPWLHRYIGNPLLSATLRLFFGSTVRDAHCGMRSIKREALLKLNLQTTGMEFASEMIIKAIKKNINIQELPINYHVRIGDSKLRTIADGWRHMRFMLLYSPLYLFFIPGAILLIIGLAGFHWFLFGNPSINGIPLIVHPMFLAALLVIAGYQLLIFALFAKTYAFTHLGEDQERMNKLYSLFTIERASFFGIGLILFGIYIYTRIFLLWRATGYGELDQIKTSVIALTLIILGIQTIFSSFMLSILGIKEK